VDIQPGAGSRENDRVGSDWAVRFGRAARQLHPHQQTFAATSKSSHSAVGIRSLSAFGKKSGGAIFLERSQRRSRWSMLGWSAGTRMVAVHVAIVHRRPRDVAGWSMLSVPSSEIGAVAGCEADRARWTDEIERQTDPDRSFIIVRTARSITGAQKRVAVAHHSPRNVRDCRRVDGPRLVLGRVLDGTIERWPGSFGRQHPTSVSPLSLGLSQRLLLRRPASIVQAAPAPRRSRAFPASA